MWLGHGLLNVVVDKSLLSLQSALPFHYFTDGKAKLCGALSLTFRKAP